MSWTSPSHSGSAKAYSAATTSVSVTAGVGDIVILGIQADRSTTGIAAAITTTGGLTWTKYEALAYQPPSSYYGTTEIWWAPAPSGLTAQTVSVGISGGGNFDNMSVIYASFPGVNTTTPWDTNAALPVAGNGGSSSLAQGTFSTTAATTCVICLLGAVTGALESGQTPTTGSTEIAYSQETSGVYQANAYMSYQCFTSPQISQVIGITQTSEQNPTWVIGALVQASAAPQSASAFVIVF